MGFFKKVFCKHNEIIFKNNWNKEFFQKTVTQININSVTANPIIFTNTTDISSSARGFVS